MENTPAEDAAAPAHVENRCIAVVGMHRSGTSATAGLLVSLGLTGPRPEDLIGATHANESGHWESLGLVMCNAQLLRGLGCAPFGPPPVMLSWDGVPNFAQVRDLALRWHADGYAGKQMMMKDPRLCLTLPFWREVLPAPIAAVFVLRNPLNVARSLQARDNLPLTLGLAVWDRYARSAALVLEGMPTLVVDYDDMVTDPEHMTGEIVRFLELVGVGVPPGTSEAASSHLDSNLRHQEARDDEYREMAGVQLEMFDALVGKKGPHAAWLPPRSLPEAPLWVEDTLRLRREWRNKKRELQGLQDSLAHPVGAVLKHLTRRSGGEPEVA